MPDEPRKPTPDEPREPVPDEPREPTPDEPRKPVTPEPVAPGPAAPEATGPEAAAAESTAAESTADKGPKPTRGRLLLEVNVPRAWLAGMLVAFIIVAVVAVIGLATANRNDTCATCHIVKPEVDTYELSAHYRAGVTCQQCHTKPGIFSFITRNLEGIGNVAIYVSGKYETPITAYVGADTCVRCHPKAQIEKDQVVGNIRVNHTGLREAGYQCLTCHANITHPGTRPDISRAAENRMSVCARCHDGKQLPDTCSTCHVGGAPAEEIDVPIQGHVTAQECAGCHQSKQFCSRCHNGLQMPHPGSFAKGHGQIVLARDADTCASCHTKDKPKFCINCHGLQMPHPAAWVSQHDNAAARDSKVCVKCHGTGSCTTCHGLQMPHPAGWQATHPSVARQSPGVCGKCHGPSFCTSCHGVSLPHGSSFIARHSSYVYSNGAVCVKCHGNGGTGPRGCYGGECHSSPID